MNKIGMEWTSIEYKWMKMYNLAARYYDANGDLLIPSRYKTSEGINLGTWIKHQRQRYKDGKIPNTEVVLLNKLGMIWNLRETK